MVATTLRGESALFTKEKRVDLSAISFTFNSFSAHAFSSSFRVQKYWNIPPLACFWWWQAAAAIQPRTPERNTLDTLTTKKNSTPLLVTLKQDPRSHTVRYIAVVVFQRHHSV